MRLALIIVAAIFSAWGATVVLVRSPFASHLMDRPNDRSLHTAPRVRAGGLGIAFAVAVLGPFLAQGAVALLLLCALPLAILSAVDDVKSVPVRVRLLVQFVVAALGIYAMRTEFDGTLNAWTIPLVLLSIVWMTNLFNFMDGADGLAGGMAAIGFGAYAIAAAHAGDAALAGTCTVIAAACIGFLAHNFPPARVFMGDAGSVPLGFLAAALGIHGAAAGRWPIAFPLLVFSPFIVDASVTLVRRAWRREPVWRAHRQHVYQRLVLAGWSHRRLAFCEYALMFAVAASAFVTTMGGVMLQCGMILVWAATYGLLFVASERFVHRMAGGAAASSERSAG